MQKTNTIKPCRMKCGENVLFIRTMKKGKNPGEYVRGAIMPVDPDLKTGNGEMTLVVAYPPEFKGRVIVKAGPEYQGYESHFATCTVYQRKERIRKVREKREAHMQKPTDEEKKRKKKVQKVFTSVDIHWRNYVKHSFPNQGKDAPTHQLVEMRKAFVSGFWGCLNEMLLRSGIDDEDFAAEALEYWRQDTDKAFREICEL